jgi:hypothetical protein
MLDFLVPSVRRLRSLVGDDPVSCTLSVKSDKVVPEFPLTEIMAWYTHAA